MKLGYTTVFLCLLSQVAVALSGQVIEINYDTLVSFEPTRTLGCTITPDTPNRGDYRYSYSIYQYITVLDKTQLRTIVRYYEGRTFGHSVDKQEACNRAAETARYQLARDNLEFHDIKVNNLGIGDRGFCWAKYLVATLGKEIALSNGAKVSLADLQLSRKAVPCL